MSPEREQPHTAEAGGPRDASSATGRATAPRTLLVRGVATDPATDHRATDPPATGHRATDLRVADRGVADRGIAGHRDPNRVAASSVDTEPAAAERAAADLPDRVFPPDSVIWKIVRHRVILLHGPAAAVLQIAHPRVGLGVMEHSRFEQSPLGRLERTLDAVYAIAFGTRDEANRAAARVARRHATVAGDAAAHGVPGEPRYSAAEIDLLMWVVATLVWSAVGGYERSVGPLGDDEKDRFYRDMRTLGTFFDLPTDYGPQTYVDYLAYFDQQVADEKLGSHPVSRRVARAVARPRTPWWLRLTGPPITFIFSELLPRAVAARLGFRRTFLSGASLKLATIALRAFDGIAPDVLRLVPQYRAAASAALRNSHADRAAPPTRKP